TTGYDFLNAVNGIFVDGRHRRAFDRLYAQFTGRDVNFRELANGTKKMIMLVSFASEVNLLAHALDRISSSHRWYRDFTRNSLVFALREIIACLPVYRTYETAPGAPAADRDRRYVGAAVAEAKRRNPRTAESLFDFVRDTLLFDNINTFRPEDRPGVVSFVLSFQQLTGPVMAKGVEDTAFYVYNRLVSLNEVGGNPSRFGTPLAAFHRANVATCRRWPHTLTASSTHDTKRSEDVRARINALSEMPVEWRAAVARWSALNRALKTDVDGQPAPDANDEYLLYQTLVGAWPLRGPQGGFVDRIVQYMRKATKEAKVHTSWVNANEGYDRAVEGFVRSALGDGLQTECARDIGAFAATVAPYGALNSLSALVLKIAAPGVPDTYQGTDLYDFSLVDPDNRRPVDYDERQRLLLELDKRGQDSLPALIGDLTGDIEQPAAKLFVLSRALRFRSQNIDLFRRGDYVPLFATGSRGTHVVGFARRHGRAWAIAAAPRLVRGIAASAAGPIAAEVWGNAALRLPRGAPDAWVDAFTGADVTSSRERGPRALYARDLFARFPLALLRPA
ncbi:MAG TPA: malto-oligosyltrehalose synthase, partial [Dehalococcoidia bacterium]|nr:malto-oligosyltrehalose synthase [Dehalococcoidia bacterium]